MTNYERGQEKGRGKSRAKKRLCKEPGGKGGEHILGDQKRGNGKENLKKRRFGGGRQRGDPRKKNRKLTFLEGETVTTAELGSGALGHGAAWGGRNWEPKQEPGEETKKLGVCRGGFLRD